MILTKGTILRPKNNRHHIPQSQFVVDSFDVVEGVTRVIDKDGWWIGSYELERDYELLDKPEPLQPNTLRRG